MGCSLPSGRHDDARGVALGQASSRKRNIFRWKSPETRSSRFERLEHFLSVLPILGEASQPRKASKGHRLLGGPSRASFRQGARQRLHVAFVRSLALPLDLDDPPDVELWLPKNGSQKWHLATWKVDSYGAVAPKELFQWCLATWNVNAKTRVILVLNFEPHPYVCVCVLTG